MMLFFWFLGNRAFKHKISLSLVFLLSLFSVQGQKQSPNIIVFLVDDMGWMDTSVPFGDNATALNKQFQTPNMERLARAGMKFTNAYATPVCTPTRTSMLTGLNAAHTGITNWTSPLKDNNTDNSDDQMQPANWPFNGLSPVTGIPHTAYATTFPQLLKDAGYFTIHVGKAHWASSGTPGANPYNMGFIVNISGHSGGHPQSYLAEDNYGNLPGKAQAQAVPDLEEYFGSDVFLTEALTREALKSLNAPIKNKQPFYLNMAHYAVHTPIMTDNRFFRKYLAAGLDSVEARYAALIEGMDKSLGDIMNYLKRKNVDKNTVIIFMSDNGGLSLSPPRGGQPHTHNLPLRAGKGSVYEGGIRVPMIVSWPDVVRPATASDEYVIIEDFFPTILEIAGITGYTAQQAIDGKSFVPALKNSTYVGRADRAIIWHYPNKWQIQDGPGINYFSAIRQGDWKLIYNMRTGKKELYNLKKDIGEANDLSGQNINKTNELSHVLADKLRLWKSPMPVLKTSNKTIPYPDE